jgi:hypothetical protein
MIDDNYNEHFAYEPEVFEKSHAIGETFENISHAFTFLGKGILQGIAPDVTLDVYSAKDPAGVEQFIACIPQSSLNEKEISDLTLHLQEIDPDENFYWVHDLARMTTLIPLESVTESSPGNYQVALETSIVTREWVDVDPNSHVTRIGGYPSFGDAPAYGQPHGKNDDGEWKKLPFIAQYILPNGKFIHIYHVDDPEGNGGTDQYELGFSIDSLNRTLVLFQDGVIPDGICLMPVEDDERSVVSEEALTVEGTWPKSGYWVQGPETDEEHPYLLMHLTGQNGYGKETERMLNYADAYIVWDCKSKGKMVEQYD